MSLASVTIISVHLVRKVHFKIYILFITSECYTKTAILSTYTQTRNSLCWRCLPYWIFNTTHVWKYCLRISAILFGLMSIINQPACVLCHICGSEEICFNGPVSQNLSEIQQLHLKTYTIWELRPVAGVSILPVLIYHKNDLMFIHIQVYFNRRNTSTKKNLTNNYSASGKFILNKYVPKSCRIIHLLTWP